jgi:hypothetical protein
LLKQDTRPRLPKKIETDASDDLAKMFDDGTPLPSTKPTPGTGSTGGTTSTPGTGGTGSTLPVAPTRDFMKVANSIHREAVPAGIFKGKGKLIYDYLYSRTRGAIVPTRTVQASWREIMKAASIGSDKTLREQLKLLRAAGLVTWEWSEGSQGGSVYTVFLPEETTGTGGTGSTGGTGGTSGQFLPPVPPVETTTGTGSLNSIALTTSELSKTSFKTNTEKTDDDEAFIDFINVIGKAVKETTGRRVSSAERQRWAELAEVLATELKIAAGRTTVSSAPSFLAEHLRRRLWKKEKRQIDDERSKEQSATAPKVDASKCLDCFGTGMWYPEGFDKGVMRCEHRALGKQDV